jgi:nicotinamide-nucleotide amidase
MRIELISTGDELLTGDITDTNASWLAQQLTEQGFKLAYKTTVSDDLNELSSTFEQRSKYADFIIVNGGLGPTSDDLSAEAAAQALGEPVVLFEQWLETMTNMFSILNRPMSDSNKKQAMLPKSASIVDNPVGTACGFKITLNDAIMVFTPGVPREFKKMVKEQILPMLASLNDVEPLSITRFLCMGIGESTLASLLKEVVLPQGCEFGYRAEMPFIELKIFSSKGQLSDEVVNEVADIVGKYCVVRDGHTLAGYVHRLMSQKPWGSMKFGTVESCTGGLVASSLVAFAGSSSYMDRGLVTYTNEAKQELADVSKQTLDSLGAVSSEVAEEMARGAVNKHNLDLAVSITGVAGPDGGSEHKPVGTVAFGLADKQNSYSQVLSLPNRGRGNIQQMACAIALDMVRRYLEQEPVIGQYDSYRLWSGSGK